MSHLPYYCRNCTRRVATDGRLCSTCSYVPPRSKILPKHGLPLGDWIPDPERPWRRIFREGPPPKREPAVKHERTRPCPKCGAQYGEPCRGPSGIATDTHIDRLEAAGILPECPDCGRARNRNKKFCDDCRLARRQAAWRRSQAKARERKAAA